MAERAPHFLRFTQAIVFVSGLGVPAAVLLTPLAACSSDPGPLMGSQFGCDCPAGDSAPPQDAGTYPDDGAVGILPYDGGAHDGTVLGVTVDAGIQAAPDSGDDASDADAPNADAMADAEIEAGGGPLAPPDLPA